MPELHATLDLDRIQVLTDARFMAAAANGKGYDTAHDSRTPSQKFGFLFADSRRCLYIRRATGRSPAYGP
jgi:hypothetical protein